MPFAAYQDPEKLAAQPKITRKDILAMLPPYGAVQSQITLMVRSSPIHSCECCHGCTVAKSNAPPYYSPNHIRSYRIRGYSRLIAVHSLLLATTCVVKASFMTAVDVFSFHSCCLTAFSSSHLSIQTQGVLVQFTLCAYRYDKLGEYHTSFTDLYRTSVEEVFSGHTAILSCMDTFRKDLEDAEAVITQRSAQRRIVYEGMLPSNVLNSTSI